MIRMNSASPNTNIKSRQKLFESWFDHYAKGLLGYSLNFVSSQQEAEDIVHDVFANLWEKMNTVSSEAVKTYLFRSTRNRCLDHISHLKVRTKYQDSILSSGTFPDVLSFEMYIPCQLQEFIQSGIDKLTPQQKRVFMMNHMEDKSFAEIAEELNISKRTVEKHYELAARFLKLYLSENIYMLLLILLAKNS